MIAIWLAVLVSITSISLQILPIGASSTDRPTVTITGRMQRASVLLPSTIGARETEASNFDNTPSKSSLLSPLSRPPYPFPSNSGQGKGGKDDPLLVFEAFGSTSSDGYPSRTPVTLLEVSKVDDSIKTTSEWCNTLDSKFDDLTRELDDLTRKLDNLYDSMKVIDRKIDTLTKQFEEANKHLEAWSKQLDTLIRNLRIFTVILSIVLVLECIFLARLFKLGITILSLDSL